MIKKWMEYGKDVNSKAGCPHKLGDCTRNRIVREATKTSVITMKELQALAGEMEETVLH